MKRTSCSRCLRPSAVCYCHTLRHINNFWPVSILQHPREVKHAIGTARIAELSLGACRLQVGERFTLAEAAIDPLQSVLIYPGGDAGSLGSLSCSVPQTLIFLDASWRKSHRMLMESPQLQALPKIGLQPKGKSRYRIRKSKYAQSLSTLEAIVLALSCLEQDEEKYSPLLESMDWMIEKQIELMGEAVFKKNYGFDGDASINKAEQKNAPRHDDGE